MLADRRFFEICDPRHYRPDMHGPKGLAVFLADFQTATVTRPGADSLRGMIS